MKRFFFILLLIILTVYTRAQDKQYFSIASKTVNFSASQPVGKLILLTDSVWLFKLTHIVGTTDNVQTIINNGWYANLSGTGGSTGGGECWRYEVTADAANNFTTSFTLTVNASVLYNGSVLQYSQWSGAGTNTLTLSVVTKRYDYITVLK